MRFGRKSEQVDRQIDRLETQLEDLAAGSGVADVRRARARASSSGASAASAKEALPPHLPREDRVLEPDSICPKCDNAMDLLGEDVSEQLARVTAMSRSSARSAANGSAPVAAISGNVPCRGCQSSAASRIRACWPGSSFRNMRTIRRCIGNPRSRRATASVSIGPPSRAGSGNAKNSAGC